MCTTVRTYVGDDGEDELDDESTAGQRDNVDTVSTLDRNWFYAQQRTFGLPASVDPDGATNPIEVNMLKSIKLGGRESFASKIRPTGWYSCRASVVREQTNEQTCTAHARTRERGNERESERAKERKSERARERAN